LHWLVVRRWWHGLVLSLANRLTRKNHRLLAFSTWVRLPFSRVLRRSDLDRQLGATKRLMHRSKEILFISSFGPIKPRQWNGKVERLPGLQVDNRLVSWSRHRPFGSEKILGRETIIETDAMPEKNCKT